jgi:hypothetical protein
MKKTLTICVLLAATSIRLLGESPDVSPTNSLPDDRWRKGEFTDVESCREVSVAYKDIVIGSSVADVRASADSPLPEGLYWPEYPQKNGSTIGSVKALPPVEWGTNYIGRTDGQSQRQFYFFHDGTDVKRIVWSEIQRTATRPRELRRSEQPEGHQVPIGPLIMLEKKPNKTPEHISEVRGRPSENAQR